MRTILPRYLSFLVLAVPLAAQGQKIDSYLSDMREALAPYGTMTAPTCHAVEIDLVGPWGNQAIPDGTDKDAPGQPTWAILKVDVLRIFVNLAGLDEDKVQNHGLYSLKYIGQHQKGSPYVADTPAVMLFTHGLNDYLTVHTVDLEKINTLPDKAHATESQMGLSIDQRKYAIVLFSDQQHADAFQKAVQKAIVLCKAQ